MLLIDKHIVSANLGTIKTKNVLVTKKFLLKDLNIEVRPLGLQIQKELRASCWNVLKVNIEAGLKKIGLIDLFFKINQ